uniref:Sperm microtubule inner protein 1 C-terminal domain-containing protein n=1 Tax=Leptobrachium leishanense TaxID=445787 RepID=A0A8C5QYW7_9ANUR
TSRQGRLFSMKDLLTTRNQNCWKELIEKETISRMTWKLKYDQEHPPCEALPTKKKRELATPKAGTPLLPLINVPKPSLVTVSYEEDQEPVDLQNLGEMRPPTSHTSQLLYDGFSKEGKGRSMYLKRRKQFAPEEKYPHPVLSSWDYGWRLGNSVRGPLAHGLYLPVKYL